MELELATTLDAKTGIGREETKATSMEALEQDPHQHHPRASRPDNKISAKVAGNEREVGPVVITFEFPDRMAFVPRAVGAEPIDGS